MADARIPTDAQARALEALEKFDPHGPCTTRKPSTKRVGSEKTHIGGTVARTLDLAGWARRSKPYEHATHWDVRITLPGRRALDRWRRDQKLLNMKAEDIRRLAEAAEVDRWELAEDGEPVFVIPPGHDVEARVYFSHMVSHHSVPPVLAARARSALSKLIEEAHRP